MQNTRRDFLKKASLLAGGAGMMQTLPLSIKKAMAINPEPGSSFEDAEHVVLLMQENRSFDHLYGALQGIRGFNDPRAITLPDSNKVWLQTNKTGKTYAPYHLDMNDSKVTWIGGLPHQWGDQIAARNKGKYDKWLEAKHHDGMPFTLGHYERSDLSFYYSLADAFTVCDQHFCSSLTGTTPNRLFYWTGTIREEQKGSSPACVENHDVTYSRLAHWRTFPECLEDNNISWKIYQNELSVGVGFKGEESSWLANFTDNPIEWFEQYHVRFHPAHITYMKRKAAELREEILNYKAGSPDRKKRQRLLDHIEKGLKKYTPEKFKKLPEREQNIHKKAFTTNVNDPYYHELETLNYDDKGVKREMKIPKGDVLHQFREDVQQGKLPTVSWLVAPQNFSDHPSAPWYGMWYVSEVLDILTKNPEVWKKTIFILTYDENDGYYDHIPPFTAPNPDDPASGKCSPGIHTEVDYVTRQQVEEQKNNPRNPRYESPIGLGYRIPLVVASPWSRGGYVNSQLTDNTSVLMFLENFLTKKFGTGIKQDNISSWRRAICGDLTSVFRPYHGEDIKLPEFVKKKPFVEGIYNAKFKKDPSGERPLTKEEIEQINRNPTASPIMQQQENGIRNSTPLPYQLYASGNLKAEKTFEIRMKAGNDIFDKKSAGSPFTMYNTRDYAVRNYAVSAGDELTDQWEITDRYHFDLYGPNGFYRSFQGTQKDPALDIFCNYERKRLNPKKLTGNIDLRLNLSVNEDACTIQITDNAYHGKTIIQKLHPGKVVLIPINLKQSHGWYDFTITIKGNDSYNRRFSGHVETGLSSVTDPAMGRV